MNNDDNDYFIEKLEKKLEINAKRYLVIKIDDDSDNEE